MPKDDKLWKSSLTKKKSNKEQESHLWRTLLIVVFTKEDHNQRCTGQYRQLYLRKIFGYYCIFFFEKLFQWKIAKKLD